MDPSLDLVEPKEKRWAIATACDFFQNAASNVQHNIASILNVQHNIAVGAIAQIFQARAHEHERAYGEEESNMFVKIPRTYCSNIVTHVVPTCKRDIRSVHFSIDEYSHVQNELGSQATGAMGGGLLEGGGV